MKSKISIGMLKLLTFDMCLSDSDSSVGVTRTQKLKPPVGMLKLLTKYNLIHVLVNTCRFRSKTVQEQVNKRRYIIMKLQLFLLIFYSYQQE